MDENTSTTVTTDNAADATSTTTATDTTTDITRTGDTTNNSASSQSTDTSDAGDKNTNTDTNKVDTPSKFDDDIDDWIEKRKLPKPATDEDKQAYQDLRNSQREFTREQQAKKDADSLKTETDKLKPVNSEEDPNEDPLEKRLRQVEEDRQDERNMRLKSEFYITNKVTADEHKAILDIFKEKMDRPTTDEGKKRAFESWSGPEALGDLLELAKARVANASNAGNTAVAERAAQEERERIARESQASSSGRSATNNSPSDKNAEQTRTQALLDRYSNNK